MKETLQAGLVYEFGFTVPETKTVPQLFPEAPEFQQMPEVFATGFMVGLCEWACIQAVNPHLDWPSEQTVGTGIFFTVYYHLTFTHMVHVGWGIMGLLWVMARTRTGA